MNTTLELIMGIGAQKIIATIAVIGSLAGCGSDNPPAPKERAGVIPEYQQRALDDAKNVGTVLQQADEQRRKDINKY